MLKRLIIAVFGVCLLVAIGSTAFAGPDVKQGLNEVQKVVANHPKHSSLISAAPTQPSFKKPSSALQPLPPGTPAPGSPSLIYFCDLQSYAGAPWYYWTIPDAFGDDLFNTRFTVEAGFECTLKVAHLLMIADPTVVGDPAGSWGAADMRVYLWGDDGFGFPGSLLDSVDILNASIPAYGYASADFSAAGWVFADGDEYHYGWTPIGGGTLACISDDGAGPYSGEERSSEYYSGAWGSMLNDWGGDYTFDIVSERCCNEIPFSDCYVQAYATNIAFVWRAPHPVFGDTSFSMRFDVGGPETLQSVDVFFYAGSGSLGDEAVNLTVYDDDGSGFPGTQLAQVTLAGGSYALYPAIETVPFAPLVVENTFHVAFSSAGVPGTSWEAILSSDGTDGVGRSTGSGDPTWPGPGTWYTMLAWWGGDYNFIMEPYLCRDEFSDCLIQPGCIVGLNYFWRLPDRYGDYINAQKIPSPGEECRVKEVTWAMYWHPAETALPLYTYPSLLNVYADAGGLPGTLLYQTTISVPDYGAPTPGGGLFFVTKDVESLEWDVTGDYWIGVESTAPDTLTGIRTLSDAGGGGCALQSAEYYGAWGHMGPDWGLPDDLAFYVEVDQCCIPFTGRVCAPAGDDWSTRSHDQARTGASQLAIGDAWCDLNMNWYSEDGDGAKTAQTMGPIIYDGRAYQVLETAAAGSSIRVYDLYTGSLVGTISGAALGNFAENDPLIVSDKLYIAGGDNRVVSRWDVSGAAVPGAPDWTATLPAAGGPLRRTNLLLVDVGGTLVLSGGTQLGRAFAINESDGLLYPGWATNPITLDAGQLVQGSATDGGQLYFGTRQAGLNGDLWTIDPATGAVNWKLSTAGGYQGATVYASITSEAFPQVSVDAGVLHVGGRPTGNFPTDGLYYRVDAGTGAVLSVTAANGILFSNPIIDINLVYLPTVTGWVSPAVHTNLMAYAKATGALVWSGQIPYEEGADNRVFNNGLLTCEPEPDADMIVYGDIRGTLSFVNSVTGEQLFRRRADYGAGANSMLGGTAIGTDSSGAVHLMTGSFIGTLFDFTKGADRPRLEIQDYDPTVAVEFSVSTSEIYTVPSIITNTGCADLTFNAVNVDTATFGSTDPLISPITPVRPNLFDAASMLADQMAANSMKFKNPESWTEVEISVENNLLSASEESFQRERGYRAALVLPPYLNSVVEPYAGQVVLAGDSSDLVLDVNPSMINRGPQVFYIELDTDDPDFFLNVASPLLPNAFPELIVTLVGGCLTDTTALEFGAGGANYQWVTNTGRLGTGDWTAHAFEIDGEDAAFYQGSYIFGVSKERIAYNSQDWSGGGGEAEAWISIQGDPNYCDNLCKPALLTGVSLGSISSDGVTYTPITGNLVAKSWIDSVQDFGYGVLADWDWKAWGAPFSDSLTMGLSANTRTVGALDVPELANVTVEIFTITNRNSGSGDSIPGWKFGVNIDYDAAPTFGFGVDTSILDVNASAAWTTSAQSVAADIAYGFIKLPYGCGLKPIKNAKGLDSGQGHFIAAGAAPRGDGYMDSAYIYMSNPQGANPSHQMTGAADQQIHGTLVEHDFDPGETISFAVAQFGFNSGVTNPRAPGSPEIVALSNLVNKWVGFGRGDMNDDNAVNLGDIMALAAHVNSGGPGAYPFAHLGDVDADNDVDVADLNYLIDYYFQCGPCPAGDWVILDCTP